MEENKQLLNAIELKRQEMIKISVTFGLSSPKTIQCSQELDKLLNQFEKSERSEPKVTVT